MITKLPNILLMSHFEMDKLKGNGFIVMTFEGKPNETVTVNNIVEIDFMDSGGGFYSVRQQTPIVNKIGTIINKHRIIEQYQFNLTGLAKQGFKVILRKNQSGNKRKRLKRNDGQKVFCSSMNSGSEHKPDPLHSAYFMEMVL